MQDVKRQTSNVKRLTYLDSSRGLAALAVLLAHFQLAILPEFTGLWLLKTPLKIFFDGEAAVLYFFILSGYVLTMSLKKIENISLIDYRKFIIRRILRIFPAFIFTLLLSYVVVHAIEIRPASWLDRYWITKPDFFSLIKQSILIKRFPNEPELRLLPHDWTLSIEMAVSFLLPMLVIISRKNALLVVILTYAGTKFLGLDSFVFDFSFGVFIAAFQEKLYPLFSNRRFMIPLLLLALIFICIDYVLPSAGNLIDSIFIHHKSFGLIIVLCFILSSNRIQKILSIKPLNFLGKISYSFYLLHLIILFAMTAMFQGIHPFLFLIIYLSITITLSTITYFQIEKPFLKIS